MKKLFYSVKWIFLAIVLLISLSALLGVPSSTFLLAVAKPIYQAVNFIPKQFGYELRCYGPHGGFSCEFVKPLSIDVEAKRQDDELMQQFRCQNDSDCVLTDEGACAVKGIVSGKSSDGACGCANGPVVSGCFPKGSPFLNSATP